MEERPLIIFTLLLQAAAGAAWGLAGMTFWLTAQGDPASAQALAARGWPVIAGLAVAGVLASSAHLGVLAHAWRAASNWRTSWLSREILAVLAFTGAALGAALAPRVAGCPPLVATLAQGLALGSAPALVRAMAGAYRLGPVPAWNSGFTPAGFTVTALLLGGLTVAALLAGLPGTAVTGRAWPGLTAGAEVLAGLSLGLTALWLARLPVDLRAALLDRHRLLILGRFSLGLLGLGAAGLGLLPGGPGAPLWRLAAMAACSGSEALGRALFYAGRLAHGVYRYQG